MLQGVPMSPYIKSLRAKFLTTIFTYLKLPILYLFAETYNIKPLPRTLMTPPIELKTTETQKATQFASSEVPIFSMVESISVTASELVKLAIWKQFYFQKWIRRTQ